MDVKQQIKSNKSSLFSSIVAHCPLFFSGHLQIADDSEVPLLEDSIEEGGEEGPPKGPHLPHQKNINVRAAFIHVIGDIIQSLGVLIASLIIKIKVS